MPRAHYNTLPDELIEFAEPIVAHFRNRGYRVQIEPNKLGFPYTPTLLCKRGKHTTLVVELDSAIRHEKLEDWVRYCRSSGKDTRLVLCLSDFVILTAQDEALLREKGIGLYTFQNGTAVERMAPIDLALNVALPDLAPLPPQLRELLGPAYDQFNRTQWREGFEEACQVLETEVRRYLKKWSRTGRIRIVSKHGPIVLSDKKINKMTMGSLASTFSAIQTQTHADSRIEQALKSINRDRVGVVHHKSKVATEKRLRTNVGSHMWVIIDTLKLTL